MSTPPPADADPTPPFGDTISSVTTTPVTVRPIGEPATGHGWCLVHHEPGLRCAGDHDDATWPDGRYCLASDHGVWCLDCAVVHAPEWLVRLVEQANATAAVLDSAPIGWQRDTAEKAIDVMRSVLIDHGL